ncbi:MAG: electron transfer flavoprotein-ubiquinone oxidoreductase [Deltaproteobacteria bacterium]|nr:MAG: electron transfer flavoprotein-ubiquinone oxidoreductase [Deltaproteobacteria bacterium]
MTESRESLQFDVLFVGGGPGNLAGAIYLMKMAQEKGMDIEVGLIEKGNSIGSHSLSGAILDLKALAELLPDYLQEGCPVEETECKEELYFLTGSKSIRIPFLPKYMNNNNCCIISLSKFTAWLGELAEDMGVNVFPGFAGTEILFDSGNSHILGVRTGDKGIDKNGNKKSNYEPGVDLFARTTVFGEGPKGSLVRDLGQKMGIFSKKMPQIFETAIKEVIEIPESSPFLSSDTTILHTFGYPLGLNTKGGGFLYKMKNNLISLGLIVGLDYKNPLLEPYKAFLQFKDSPMIAEIIQGGKVLQQGAKTLSAGGYYTMPRLAVNGAVIVGDSASLLNTQRLKGIHTAMKSGMLAAETIIAALEKDDFSYNALQQYELSLEKSWIKDELYEARNFAQALSKNGILKFIHLGGQYLTGGKGIIDPLSIRDDSSALKKFSRKKAPRSRSPEMPVIDGELYIDKLTGVFRSGTKHEEDQPCHIIVHDPDICSTTCFEAYRNPCIRFCPGEVYEMEEESSGKRRLRINPSNCLHCKTCEIKDPYKNITWTCPEGGGGPNYTVL